MLPVIEVNSVSKQYHIGAKQPYLTLRDSLIFWVKNFPKENKPFWALKNISFEVVPGQIVGIIGGNGAGKSTLLKILSRITPPTLGEVVLRGRVSSLLEVGTGFSPELTGRENIFLNGAILGMTRREIKRKFDEIVNFSGVEKFLDTPVKHFSSGMYIRLAFSVASHLDSDILLLDEVLAVGDSEFQKRCMNKMENVTRTAGRTILFVSHNLHAVQKLCQISILLQAGRIKAIGDSKAIIDAYLNERPKSLALRRLSGKTAQDVKFVGAKITNINGSGLIRSDDRLRIVLKYASNFRDSIPEARVIITVQSQTGEFVLRLDSNVTAETLSHRLKPNGEVVCETDPINLAEGKYFVNLDFSVQDTDKDYVERATEFEVITNPKVYGFRYFPDKAVSSHLVKYRFQ